MTPSHPPRSVHFVHKLRFTLLAGYLLAASIAHAGIAVYPGNSTIDAGSTRQYTAYVPLNPNTVEWMVNGTIGGSATFGKIDGTGRYVAPAMIPLQNTVTIQARSTAYPTTIGSLNVAINRPYPWLWSVYPSSVSVGEFQVSLNGANYAPDSQVLVNGQPMVTTFVSATKLIASGTAASPSNLQVSVRQPGPGSQTGNSVSVPVTAASVTVTVSPTAATLLPGGSKTFFASVAGSSNPAVSWSITTGAGSIDHQTGVYTAPAQLPASPTVTLRATSVASPTAFATATVTLLPPPPPPVVVTVSPASVTVQLGQTTTFSSIVTGTSNTAVTWSILTGGGSVDAATGTYSAPASMPPSSTVSIRATSVANPSSTADATVSLVPPPPAITSLANARFLEQSSFGPSPATLAELGQKGITTYLADQFAMQETLIPTPPNNTMGELRQWCLYNYTTAPDQLRQRVAYSLSQILVTSSNKLIYPDAMLPWMRLLSQHAFGNYRDLLHDITLCPSMGKYLDLAYSSKASVSGAANENYARELMQLFTIGLWELNLDGTTKLDANDQPIPTYDQHTVAQLSLALTGWVYAGTAYEDFTAPMIPQPWRHDTGTKSFLGSSLPSGQSVQEDLEGVLDVLMNHPNIAPFISVRLIRSLVTSNPSPAYVQRIASVFNDDGTGVKGNLKAVISAILLDSEARDDVPNADSGRLKEPILHVAGLLRALGDHFASDQQMSYLFEYMSQPVLEPPSVFSWFSPLYRLPGDSSLAGPEFQIYSPTDATLRGNLFYLILHQPATDMVIDLSPFKPYGNDMPGLVEAANEALLYGRMPAGMKQAIINAAVPGYDAQTRIETVLYLTALSGQYAVQH